MPVAVSELKEINLDYLKLEVDVPRLLIRLYWKRQVNNSELRTGFYTAAQVAETYGCKYWLGDARNTTMLDIADQDMVVKDLLSIISNSGIRKVARLVDVLEAVVTDSFSMKFKIESKHPDRITFETAVFTDVDSALDWLFK